MVLIVVQTHELRLQKEHYGFSLQTLQTLPPANVILNCMGGVDQVHLKVAIYDRR